MLFGHYDPTQEDFWNIDPGTAELRTPGGQLAGVVAVTVSSGVYTERWALFHGGATTGGGEPLGSFPTQDFPPAYDGTAHLGRMQLLVPAAGTWDDVHTEAMGSLEEFGTYVLQRVGSVYTNAMNGGIEANATWVDGTWEVLGALTPGIITALVAAEHDNAGSTIDRWFQARRGRLQIGRVYAEHANGNSRVVYQSAAYGLAAAAAPTEFVFDGAGSNRTLRKFLERAEQERADWDWITTRGTATSYDELPR